MSEQRSVAEVILDQLSAWGVKNIYGLVGDDIFYLMDALGRRNTIKFYQVKHEESAAIMASAQAKLTGETGVCLVDGGPGTAHLINGLADAFMDRVPVLAITGQVARKDIGANKKQYVDQQSLLRPLVSYTGLLCDPAAAPQVLENAWRTAFAGKSVSHFSVPMDVLAMPCKAAIIPPAPYLGTQPRSPAGVVEGALELMRESHRPVILAGSGSREAAGVLGELSLRWGAAIVTTLAGTGVVDRYHPYYVGGLGHAGSPSSTRLLSQADLCLVVGANWWPKNYVPKGIPVIQIDLNPAHIGSTMPVAYGLVGDAQSILEQLSGSIIPDTNREWTGLIRKEINSWLTRLEQETSVQSSPVHPAALIRSIQELAPDDAIICLDTGDHTVWFGRVFRPVRQQVLLSGKWRTMGFGLPAALAAKINRPAQKVLALVGDGGFAMTMADFLTAVKYNLDVTIVVMNNSCLAMEKNKMVAGGLLPEGTSLQNPDFAGYANSCGGLGLRVEHSRELVPALRDALNNGGPSLVDVKTSALAVPGTTMPV